MHRPLDTQVDFTFFLLNLTEFHTGLKMDEKLTELRHNEFLNVEVFKVKCWCCVMNRLLIWEVT